MRNVAAALGLAVVLAACTMQARTGTIGDDVSGAAVAQTIDIQIAPSLRSVPGLVVAPAACPERLDVSRGKTGYCVLRAGGMPLRIAVIAGTEYGKVLVKQAQALIDMRGIERRERASLAFDYGLRADVRCGTPRFRVAVAGARFTCALSGRGLPADHVDAKVVDNAGHVFLFNPHGAKSPVMSALAPYLHSHKIGRPAIVPGKLIARYIEIAVRETADETSALSMPIGAATCPALVDLSAARRGRCRQRVAGRQLRVDVWLQEPVGINAQTIDFAIDTKRLAADAADLYRGKLEAAGYHMLVGVECGPDRIAVATQQHGIPCTLTYGAKSRPLTAVPDASGRGMRYYVPDLAPTPAPR